MANVGSRKHQSQIEFLSVTFRRRGQVRNEGQGRLQVSNSFRQCHSAQRALPGGDPVRHRALIQRGLREVTSQQFRPVGHDVGELLLQHLRDLGMQLLALRFEQRVVGGVLHQRMLEGIGRCRWRTLAEDQSRIDQLLQPLHERLARHGSYALEQ